MMMRNVAEVLARPASSQRASHSAILSARGDISYGELWNRSVSLSATLRAYGVKTAEPVLVLLGSRPEWFETFFALNAGGMVPVPVTSESFAPAVESIRPRIAIVDEVGLDLLRQNQSSIELSLAVGVTDIEAPTEFHFESRHASRDARLRAWNLPYRYPCLVDSTTGKGIVIGHDGILANCLPQIHELQLSSSDVNLIAEPLSGILALYGFTLALFALGASNIVYDGSIVDTEQLLDCADRQGATNLFLPGSTIEQIARTDCGVDKIRQGRIRMIVAHGAVSPEAVIELDSALPDVSILRSWGVNELPWPATVLPSALARVQPDSVGVAMSHCRIAVKSPDGDISGDGTGELLIRSRARMRGYLPAQADHGEKEAILGWLNTGRVGTVDKLGCVYMNENGFT